MTSPTAIADIKAAISSGVKLTPEEIIRLNALGLRYDYTKSGSELRIMPRVAWLGEVAFLEPTIGHEIWMNEIDGVFNLDDPETRIKVRAYCLATPPLELPSLSIGKEGLKEIVERFVKDKISQWTLGQVACALMFAENGDLQTSREVPEPKPMSRKEKRKPIPDGEYCYEVGLLRNGILLNLGSPDELKKMTVAGVEKLVVETMKMDSRFGMKYAKDIVSDAFADYKRTLDIILKRHSEEGKKDGIEQDRA